MKNKKARLFLKRIAQRSTINCDFQKIIDSFILSSAIQVWQKDNEVVINTVDSQRYKAIKQAMLNKYEQFIKISKNQQCSLYTGVSRETGKLVLLKRFKNKKLSWDQVLKNKNMQLTQKRKMFPKMIEIFKSKGQFYVVYERPTGPSLDHAEQLTPLSKQDFYVLFDDLLKHLRFLKSCVPGLYFLPEWAFIHRRTVKLVHFQPFFINREAINSDHVYLYKVQNQIRSTQSHEFSQSSLIATEKTKNIVFNLGMLALKLLTGPRMGQPETEDDQLAKQLQTCQNAQKRVLQATNDKPLARLVAKMLNKNVFQLPQLDQVASFIQSKAQKIAPKKRAHTSQIEIQFEHLKLGHFPHQERQIERRVRPCCRQKQTSLEKIKYHLKNNKSITQHKQEQKNRYSIIKKVGSPRIAQDPNRQLLPTIKIRRQNNKKAVMSIMNTTNSKPLNFSKNTSLVF